MATREPNRRPRGSIDNNPPISGRSGPPRFGRSPYRRRWWQSAFVGATKQVLVQEWLALPGRRIKLHFIPTYCPHLNPIERLWGLMHRNVTHNKCYATCAQFADATLSFLREKVPGNWADLCDLVTDNFRIINPKDFRVMT